MSVRPVTLVADRPTVGLFGKLPARRDFVQHGVGPATLGLIEPWLHASLHASRMALGDDWSAIYMDAPIWRFRCDDDRLIGPLLGVLMASVDGVGREFPLLVLSQHRRLEEERATPIVPNWRTLDASKDRPWYDAAEDVALSALEEGATLEDVLRQATRLASCGRVSGWADERRLHPGPTPARRGGCVWWASALKPDVAPIAFASALPPPGVFAFLLAGTFAAATSTGRDLPEDGAA